MNVWQVEKQLRYLLRARLWQEAGGVVVFGSVHITNTLTEKAVSTLRTPFVLIQTGGSTADPERPGYVHQEIPLILCVGMFGDQFGESAMIGANRPTTGVPTASQGRGLLEVEEELLGTVRQVQETSGVKIVSRSKSSAEALIIANRHDVYARSYNLEADCTDQRYYHPPLRLAATGGVGSVSLTWSLPPDRYDRRQILLRRAVGATPPASSTAGTGVTLGGLLATSVSDGGLAPGTYSYAIFCGYDETASGGNQRFSEQENGTTRASVVVT